MYDDSGKWDRKEDAAAGSEGALERVMEFVSWRLGVPQEGLRPQTTLKLDLDLDGNAAAALLTALGERFAVDLAALDFETYFRRDDQIVLLAPPLEIARRCGRRWACRLGFYRPGPQITLGDLARAVAAGRWMGSRSPTIQS